MFELDSSGFAALGRGRDSMQSRTVYKKQRTSKMDGSMKKKLTVTKSQKKLTKATTLEENSLAVSSRTASKAIMMESTEEKKTPMKPQ